MTIEIFTITSMEWLSSLLLMKIVFNWSDVLEILSHWKWLLISWRRMTFLNRYSIDAKINPIELLVFRSFLEIVEDDVRSMSNRHDIDSAKKGTANDLRYHVKARAWNLTTLCILLFVFLEDLDRRLTVSHARRPSSTIVSQRIA